MKVLYLNNKELILGKTVFKADRIVIKDNNIAGYMNNSETPQFALNCITNISDYSVKTEEGTSCEFDTIEPTQDETLSKEVAILKISDMKKDLVITNTLQTIASLKVEIMGLKGGSV